MDKLLTKSIFKNGASIAHDLICSHKYPWEAVGKIPEIIKATISSLSQEYEEISEGVYVFKGVKIPSSATICGPTIICEGAEIRQGAYIRGNAIIGKGCVVGNSSEVKCAILYDKVAIPHFNYVGNSILGYGAHLGASAIISNLKGDKSNIKITYNQQNIDTGLRKFGAIVAERVEVGCGAVLNPGTIILENTQIYPLSLVRGVVPPCSIYKAGGNIVPKS